MKLNLKPLPLSNPVEFRNLRTIERDAFDFPKFILPGLPPQVSSVGSTGHIVIAGTDGSRRLNFQARFVLGDEVNHYVWTEERDPTFWPATPSQAERSGWEIIFGILGKVLPEDLA